MKTENFMKRLFIIIMMLLCTAMLFSCGKSEDGSNNSQPSSASAIENDGGTVDTPVHEHTYAKGWITTEDGHYKECICHPEIKEIAAHMDYVDRDGRCDVCMAVMVEAKTYTVTVLDEGGVPIQNAELKIYTMGEEKLLSTNSQGTAAADFIYSDGIKAMLISLPDGYTLPSKLIYTFSTEDLIIDLSKQ